MSKHMVKLLPCHQRVRPFKHPLLDQADPPLMQEEIDALLPSVFEKDEDARHALVIGHLSMLRHTVGRYLYHWAITRRLCNEMVSEGLYAMVRAVNRLTDKTLGDNTVGPYLLNNITAAIEDEVARLRGICPASPRTNRRYAKDQKEPVFGEVEADIASPVVRNSCAYTEPRFEEFDVLEIIHKLQDESSERELLLNEEYWGLSDQEIAAKTGIPRRTISWYRSELLKRYKELTGD